MRLEKNWDIHADDFAVSLHASKDIVHLCKMGKLDSISILPNMSCYRECIDMLKKELLENECMPKVSVHLNFMEGHCVFHSEALPDLVDENGFFKISWGSLLLANYMPWKRKRIKEQLKKELKAQLGKIVKDMPEGYVLRIDSHQHTHMIPMVFSSLMEVVSEENLKVEFIRNSEEPLLPFLSAVSLYRTYEPLNFVKNIIIKWYGIHVRKLLKKQNLTDNCLWGLVMSGCMDEKRIVILKKKLFHIAKQRGQSMEVLFHPGSVLPDEIGEEFVKDGFVDFHLSKGRRIECHAVRTVDWSEGV